MRNTGFLVGGLLLGAALGASVALLYAPQKGSETRELVKSKLKEMEEDLDKMRKKMGKKGGELKDETKKKIEDLESRINSLIKEFKKNEGSVQDAD